MYGSRIVLAGLLAALGASPALGETGGTHAGRLALLAGEAAALSHEAELVAGEAPEAPPGLAATGAVAPPSASSPIAPAGRSETPEPAGFGSIRANLPPGPVSGIVLGALALAALAAYLATHSRVRRVAASREEDGEVREVTWRFRSPQPIRVGGESARRVAEVLDEIEQLGQQLRAITTTPAGSRPASSAAAPAPQGRGDEDEGGPAVVFTRRAGSDAPPLELPTAPAPPATEPARVANPEPVAVRSLPAPAPAPSRAEARQARYEEARLLLRSGHDRAAVLEATGLKLAEIDLLRCTHAGERAA